MTAPALPGAAPDPAPGRNDTARLPPEVDAAIVEAVLAATNFGVDGRLSDLQKSQDAVVALRTAIARALGGDGEPVAWGYGVVRVVDGLKWGSVYGTRAEADNAIAGSPVGHYAVVPLYIRPAATGADIDRAVREAAEQEREAIAAWHDAEADRIRQEIATSLQIMRENASAFVGLNTSMDHEYAQAETHRECAAVIRARGAKS